MRRRSFSEWRILRCRRGWTGDAPAQSRPLGLRQCRAFIIGFWLMVAALLICAIIPFAKAETELVTSDLDSAIFRHAQSHEANVIIAAVDGAALQPITKFCVVPIAKDVKIFQFSKQEAGKSVGPEEAECFFCNDISSQANFSMGAQGNGRRWQSIKFDFVLVKISDAWLNVGAKFLHCPDRAIVGSCNSKSELSGGRVSCVFQNWGDGPTSGRGGAVWLCSQFVGSDESALNGDISPVELIPLTSEHPASAQRYEGGHVDSYNCRFFPAPLAAICGILLLLISFKMVGKATEWNGYQSFLLVYGGFPVFSIGVCCLLYSLMYFYDGPLPFGLKHECPLAFLDRRAENIRVHAVVIPELELGDIEVQILFADVMECADDPALEDAPEAFNRVRVNGAGDVFLVRVERFAKRGWLA